MRKLFFFWVLSVLFSFVNQPEAKEVMQPLTEKEEKLVEISMYTARGDMPELKKTLADTQGIVLDSNSIFNVDCVIEISGEYMIVILRRAFSSWILITMFTKEGCDLEILHVGY